jgi:hypothetical protein
MLPLIASIVSGLISNGLPKVADAVIEKGVDAVQEKLGIELKPEHEMTPEHVSKLKEEAMKHEEFMAELDEKSRQRATDMQMAAMKSDDPLVRRFIYYFIAVWSGFAIVFIPSLIWAPIPDSGTRYADTILGYVMGTIVTSMFAFLLGSSQGSRMKDDRK